MNLVVLSLQFYFASMLGVAGLAKIEHPEQFADTMALQRILPRWSLNAVSRIVPWIEVVVALLLMTGLAPLATSSLTLLLFTSFLAVEVVLLKTKYAGNCGCYGASHLHRVDGGSVAASVILSGAAALNLWAAVSLEPVPMYWRLPGLIILGGVGAYLVWSVVERRRAADRRLASVIARLRVEVTES